MAKGFKTGGRKKGTPNKATAAVREAVVHAFHEVGGAEYLIQLASSDPRTFCTLISKVIPLQVEAELEHGLTDEVAQLVTEIRDLRQRGKPSDD